MPIGAHVSTAGGLSTSVGRAQAMGAECMQIFLSTPQRWQRPKHTDEQVAGSCACVRAASAPNFAHADVPDQSGVRRPGHPPAHDRQPERVDRLGRPGWPGGLVVHVGSGREPARWRRPSPGGRHASSRCCSAGGACAVLLENSAGSGRDARRAVRPDRVAVRSARSRCAAGAVPGYRAHVCLGLRLARCRRPRASRRRDRHSTSAWIGCG